MKEEYREPWEALSLIVAGYLALSLWHCLITVMEYAMVFGEVIECIEVPLIL